MRCIWSSNQTLQRLGILLDSASALVFDVDGVLVDSQPYHDESWRIAGAALGLCQEVPLEMVGRLDNEIAASLTNNPHDAERLLRHKRQALNLILQGQPPTLVAGVREFIAVAGARGIPLAVSSNSNHDRVLRVLDHHGLTSAFSFIATARSRCQPKPSPEVYASVLAALEVPAETAVAIEDSLAGVQSAKAAGLKVIALRTPWTHDSVSAIADGVVDGFDELIHLLSLAARLESVPRVDSTKGSASFVDVSGQERK